jgi:molecular chaperone DnaK
VDWQSTGSAPPGSPTLWAVRPRPDGSLVSCGTVGTTDRPSAGCWVQRGDSDWQPLAVGTQDGSPQPLYIYALADTADGLVAVGAGRGPSGVDAAQWTVAVHGG